MMSRRIVSSNFRLVTVPLLVIVGVVTGLEMDQPVPTTAAPVSPTLPPYDVRTEIHTVTPTCIQLAWSISPPLNHSAYADNIFRIARVKTWMIRLNTLHSNEQTVVNELFIDGATSNFTVGPFPLGATVTATVAVQKYIKPDGHTKEGGHITSGVDTVQLPRSDSHCPWPYGRRNNPCSECVCTTTAFTGPRCQDPNFHPRNVSVWILANGSLHIQWTFNATKYRNTLSPVNFKPANFSLSITEASGGHLVVRDVISFNQQSDTYNYNVYKNIRSGVEYDVTVGTVASCSSKVIVANASSLRTIIPDNFGTIDSQDGDTVLSLSGAALPGVVVGVAIFSYLLATIVTVIIAVACARRRKSVTSVHDRPEPVRAQNPSTSANLSRPPLTRVLPSMERNPAYGASSFGSSNFGSPSFGSSPRNFFVQDGQLASLSEGYGNENSTEDKTGTGTYDYVVH